MSENYEKLIDNSDNLYVQNGRLKATTCGCGCCADSVEVTKEYLEDTLEEMQDNVKILKKLIKNWED